MYEKYINPELFILIPVLNIIGTLLKSSKVKNNLIPVVLSLLSILLSTFYLISLKGFSFLIIFDGIVQGLLCSASSVYLNQLVKQANKEV